MVLKYGPCCRSGFSNSSNSVKDKTMSERFDYVWGSSNNATPLAVSGNSNAVNVFGLERVQFTAEVTDITHPPEVFTAAGNIVTAAGHGLVLGQVFQVSNSGGALPTGLSGSTNYYAIPIDGDTLYVADSYAHAIANTKVTLSSTGSGTNTLTPTSLAGGTITLQSAQANQNGAVLSGTWKDVPNTATSVAATGIFNFPVLNTDFPFYRLRLTGNTAGTLGLVATYSGK